jgi:hypothetical protein
VIFHLLCLRLIFIWHYSKNLASCSKHLFNTTCKETSEMVKKPYIMRYPNVSNSKYFYNFHKHTFRLPMQDMLWNGTNTYLLRCPPTIWSILHFCPILCPRYESLCVTLMAISSESIIKCTTKSTCKSTC